MSSASPSFLHGTAMLVIWGSVDHPSTTNTDTNTDTNTTTAVDETALNAWWTNEHLPERLAILGFHRTRRYYNYTQTTQTTLDNTQAQTKLQTPVPSSPSSQYLVTYEVSSLSTLTSPAYMTALNNPTERTKRFMPVLASMNRSACRVLYSVAREEFSRTSTTTGDDHSSTRRTGIGAALAHIVFQPPSGTQDNLRKWIEEIGWPSLAAFPPPLAMHLLEHDDEATKSGSATKSYEDVTFQTNTNTHTKPGEGEGKGESGGGSKGAREPLGAPFGKASALTGTVVDKLNEMDAKEIDVRLYGLICALNE
ncbi:hypothetical protein LTR67_002288 [Exophiala xenobiotica]